MTRADIPRSLTDVTPAWLTAALRAGGRFFASDAGHITTITPGAATQGIAISSTVMRLRLEVQPAGAGPSAAVIKLVNPAWTHGTDLHRREVAFYRELGGEPSLPIARCYYADCDEPSGDHVLVLEDLGNTVPGHRLDGVPAAEMPILIDALAQLHHTWWQQPRLHALGWPGRNYTPERAREILAKFHRVWPKLEADPRFPMDASLHAAVADISDDLVEALLALLTQPRTLTHNDLHTENFVIDTRERPRLVLFDWQHAALSQAAFDVANALACLCPDVDHNSALERYHANLSRDDYSLARLRADTATATQWVLVSSANWFATFEPESPRDAETIQSHWRRLSAAVARTGSK